MCVCVHACAFGRLKVTVAALLRPAHLPQSVNNQGCSMERTAPVIGECARARRAPSVVSPAFVY